MWQRLEKQARDGGPGEGGCRGEGVARRGFFVLDTNGEESAAPVPVRRGFSLCCWGSSSRLALAVRFKEKDTHGKWKRTGLSCEQTSDREGCLGFSTQQALKETRVP